ncbi:NAD(P)/FAD-dependent oxidoreductase [Pseudonocardia sp. GCM10023141]|uniref:NAD(P)/FAD-dependent oxidoreductase n=1 Tax=Pseudonocardia sp. GCM10023141 TaxID=3252653 RepID=UPI0036206349
MSSPHRPGTVRVAGRAVVLGASIAGLLAARTLSDVYDEVVVIDRDPLTGTGPRKGVPQGRHAHVLLARGHAVLEELFPGLTADLVGAGAVVIDQIRDTVWMASGRRLAQAPSDLRALAVSRPALEDHVRDRVQKLPGVTFRGGHEATRLLASADRGTVTGVELADLTAGLRCELAAELVVDATGRSNRGATWLAELGYVRPAEEVVKATIAYASRQYVRSGPLASGAMAIAAVVMSPEFPQGAAVLPMEGDRWMVTLIGLDGNLPPTDIAGFDRFSRLIPSADLHDVVDGCEPLTEPLSYRVPASVRRRYERLRRLPDRYLVIGDALCAFNPIYGQGMTVSAIEATVLRECLQSSTTGLPRRFYRQAARAIDIPWDIAAGGDLALPTVTGKRTLKTRLLNAYVARILRAAERDAQVGRAFHRSVNLISRPTSLFAPWLLLRALAGLPATAIGRRPTVITGCARTPSRPTAPAARPPAPRDRAPAARRTRAR